MEKKMNFDDYQFKKAQACQHCSHCVEVAIKDDVVVRNNKNPQITLTFTREEWQVFIAGVKNGEFDFINN